MMETTAETLAQRRRELIARCAEQRSSVHLQVDRWRHTLSPHEIALTGLDYVKRYQFWIVGAAIAIVAIKPRRLRTWLQTGTTVMRTWRSIAPFVQTAQQYLLHDKASRRMH
jgi:hypothetical protein